MNKTANKATPAIKPADKSAKAADKSTKLTDKSTEKSTKTTDKSSFKSTDRSSTRATIKSIASAPSEDRSSIIEELVPEENPNCQCLGDCNCIRLRTSETISGEDGPGICVDFQPQHLILDFTPTDELETPANLEAYLRMWDMLAKVPEWAKALGSEGSESPMNDLSPRSPTEEPESEEKERDHMAVSILNLMDKAGVTVPVFEAKEKPPYCVDEQQDYFKVPSQVSSLPLPVRTSVKYSADGRPSIERKEKLKPKKPDLEPMITHLNYWDDCHPKSMEPPGHPPETSSMILARRKKKYGPCHPDCNDCARHLCDKGCGCHHLQHKH